MMYFGSWVLIARGYRPDTQLLPMAVGVTTIAIIGLRVATVRLGVHPGGFVSNLSSDTENVDTRRALIAFAWLIGLVVVTTSFGLVIGILLTTTAFVARYDRRRRAVVIGPGTAAIVYVLFVLLLNLPPYDPIAIQITWSDLG
jgi:hypothetical protein